MSYDGETCQDCGVPVVFFIGQTYWHAKHALWNLVMGGPRATDDPGGVVCPRCFTVRCDKLGIFIHWEAVEGTG